MNLTNLPFAPSSKCLTFSSITLAQTACLSATLPGSIEDAFGRLHNFYLFSSMYGDKIQPLTLKMENLLTKRKLNELRLC